MQIKFIIFILFLLYHTLASDYQPNYIQRCSQVTQATYSNNLRNVFILHSYDQMIIKAMFPFSFLACLGTIIIYIKFQGTRQQPGDIILALAISQIFLLISFISTVIYNGYFPYNQPIPKHFSAFCQVTGYAYTLSFCAQFIYNICFCGYFVIRVRNILKSLQNIRYFIHIMCLLLLAVAAAILFLTDCIGVSLFGFCAFKVSRYSPYFRSILILVYLICLSVTILVFRKYVPNIKNNQIARRNFLSYYYRYNLALSINLSLQTVFNLISAINCNAINPNPSLQIFLTFSNISSLTTPFIFFFVVAWHPEVKATTRRLWYKLTIRQNSNDEQNKGDVQLISGMKSYKFLENILETTKSSLIYTILVCLYIQDYESQNFETFKQLNDWNYSDYITYQTNQQLLKNAQNIKLNQFKLVNSTVKAYSPRAFKTLMHYDGFVNLRKHVNPKLNEQQIKKCTQSNGGKSGQFFFFTHDNKLILKTLKKQQLNILLQRLNKYMQHFANNPHSLIIKIYGIYTFLDLKTNKQYNILVMRNISGCSKKYVERIYDLKGSKFDRKVLKQYNNANIRIKQTMKDIDFLNLQKKIYINIDQAQKIKSILIKDSKFMVEQKLIDYSLIVMKISIKDYLSTNNIKIQQFLNLQPNPYSIILSSIDQNIAYAIGIIDYLQIWNTKKKSQKFTKKIIFFTNSDDISAQSPQKYGQRFQKQLVNIIF